VSLIVNGGAIKASKKSFLRRSHDSADPCNLISNQVQSA
jgi:hypothetical protein